MAIEKKMKEETKYRVTLVSTLPFKLREEKPGMYPSIFMINEAKDRKNPGITHIGNSYYTELIPFADHKAPPRRVDVMAERVAQAIVNDYVNASLGVRAEPLDNGSVQRPGLFVIDEVLPLSEVKAFHSERLELETNNTISWFESLVRLADDDWQRFHQHKMITDLQRAASRYLGLEREWSASMIEILASVCPACKVPVNPSAVICGNCKCILKPEEHSKFQFAS